MLAESWVREISENDRKESVLRLTPAKDRIPSDAFIDGKSPESNHPPAGKIPIEITWANGTTTKHFVRSDSNRYMITDRTEAVREFYDAIGSEVTELVITAVDNGKFIITPRRVK